jgi:hypothetical protein
VEKMETLQAMTDISFTTHNVILKMGVMFLIFICGFLLPLYSIIFHDSKIKDV